MSTQTSDTFPSGMEKPVCVFCGSSPGKSTIHAEAARAVGQALANANVPLVYGGGRRGIMGVVSQATLEAGGHVHGIVPRALVTRASEKTSAPTVDPIASSSSSGNEQSKSAEGTGKDLMDHNYDGRLTMSITESMHERKMQMAKISTGGFIVLPGGYGTFEEALEMITWNQLKIHQLPVVILNIDNFYTPLRTLFDSASASGFINPENLSLVKIVDLPGGEKDNADLSKAADWGKAAVDAIKNFTFSAGAGYNLSWKSEEPESKIQVAKLASESTQRAGEGEDPPFSLFSTARYTSPSPPSTTVQRNQIPLLDRHIARLRSAWEYFSNRDGEGVWGDWPGDDVIWDEIKRVVEASERQGGGDWRVRILLHKGGQVEVQLIPASPSLGPFDLTLPPLLTQPKRTLVLSPTSTILSPGMTPFRLNKTTHRQIYTDPLLPFAQGTEVLLHTPTHLLETCTSNIALHLPDPANPGAPEWITPALGEGAEFLAGVVRAELVQRGMVRVGEVTMADWDRCRREKRGIVGFNGFVGVWAAHFDD